MPPKPDEITGTFQREKWRPAPQDIDAGNLFVIAQLNDGTVVKGPAPVGDLIPGLTYRFFGQWEESDKYGKSFKFSQFTKAEPHSRYGLVHYLKRYAPNIGPALATRLYDAFGGDACKVLRTDPDRAVGAIKGLTNNAAREASKALTELAELEDTKIELTNLFAGRGFPGILIEQTIKRWGILAPTRIRRDPFTLLVEDFAGCGFLRCDRLCNDLGLHPGRLKRQMICLWNALKSDMEGHTWVPLGKAEQQLRQSVAGVKLNLHRAVKLGIRSRWLAVKRDARGQVWIAHGKRAENERYVAEKIGELMRGPVVLPRFTQQLPGECDHTDEHVETATVTDELGNERVFVNGVEFDVNTTDELDVAELARIGRETGRCQFCGRPLTNPVSLTVGYGPHCAERWNLPWGDAPTANGDRCIDSVEPAGVEVGT